jgi:hypothetical protein
MGGAEGRCGLTICSSPGRLQANARLTHTYVHIGYIGGTQGPSMPKQDRAGSEGNTAMSRKKLSTTIYVTAEQNDALKQLHARTKVPIAVYIREGIDMVLHTYSHLLPGQLPLAVVQDPPKSPTPVAEHREVPTLVADADADDTPKPAASSGGKK